jgi:hypothetical protein
MATKNITDEMVVDAVNRTWGIASAVWPYELLSKETGECEKVCYRAMERADRHGLIEWGVSLRSGWLTPRGKKLLQ